MTQLQVSIIASEGGAGYYPENTAYAVRQSLKQTLDGVELDFHLTADNHFVVHHDYSLNKDLTRDQEQQWLVKPGPMIKDTTLEALRKYELGMLNPESKQAGIYPLRQSIEGERIATYTEIESVIQKCDNPEIELWFEAKTNPYDLSTTTRAADYVEHLQNILNQSDIVSRIVLIAFDWSLLVLAKEKIPGIQTGFLTIDPGWLSRNPKKSGVWDFSDDKNAAWYGSYNPAKYNNSIQEAVSAAGGTYWSPYFRDLDRQKVDEAHHLGIKVSTWGADKDAHITQALDSGVDSLTTGYVDRAKRILKART